MTNYPNSQESVETSLLALRVGCGLFALIQGLFKFLLPAQTFVWMGALVTPRPSGHNWPVLGLGIVEIVLGVAILLGLALHLCGWLFAAWSLFYGTLAIGGVVMTGGSQLVISGNANPSALFAMFIAQAMIAGLMPAGIALASLGTSQARTDS